ncbi:secretoglobin family 2A member 2-like [Ornithorhynchus anatinus]|uniref:secretoglobin family 2A member 2-like n=1 Tax=Ornithorhynchus anatinus TaxID=9258 RepID=UPI0010A8A721|nr:secretoglobin family 2A member 2-like [Ornithorhynchus anatinus]
MKLVIVLVLVTLPLCCYAGSGCSELQNMLTLAINGTKDELFNAGEKYITTDSMRIAISKAKDCFLQQPAQNLDLTLDLMNLIYNSQKCSAY